MTRQRSTMPDSQPLNEAVIQHLRPRPEAMHCASPGLVPVDERQSGRRVRRDDHLGALKILDLGVTGRGHGTLEGTHEVQRAVRARRGAVEDLLERARRSHVNALTARHVRVGCL